ncbi:polyketide cyclase [Nocardioides sp. Root151]|uniref:polyketide cyclase n=1 Tax=Nocardioides sp. Root151 TaxID=1736475 RepID=UPI0007029D0D|nr:polyketide cyclase [Nocardioides sp. Root151]KQZ67234.1 polyketide cyclase [Nocardioides sp. Root151]
MPSDSGTRTDERIEVQRTVAATPDDIFAVLCDPLGHVDIDSSGMLMDATGDPVTGVGDRFVVHMDREALGDVPMGEYDVEVVIERFDAGREIGWSIVGTIKPPIGHVYGYRLDPTEPAEDGTVRTLVTSYYDWSTALSEWKAIFPVISEANLKGTLGILARTVKRRGRV